MPKRFRFAARGSLAAALMGLAMLVAAALPAARAALAAPAATRDLVDVQFNDVWIAEPPPGAQVAAAYFTMSNVGHGSAVLIGVRCPLAKSATLHRTMEMDGESMMRPVGRVSVAPTHVLALRPDGLHVMLQGLRERLFVGEQVPLVVRFEGGQEVHLTATVRPPGGQ
jgi:periplasmic copper chaperone A